MSEVPEPIEVLRAVQNADFDDPPGRAPDHIEVVYLQMENGIQPIVWPMVLHVHTQECFRA